MHEPLALMSTYKRSGLHGKDPFPTLNLLLPMHSISRSGHQARIRSSVLRLLNTLESPHFLVSEISRVLKPGGAVVITTPNDRSVWGIYELLWDVFGRGRNYGETHLRFFSEPGLRDSFSTFSECTTKSIFFISPLFAITNSPRLLEIGKKLDCMFERWGWGVSLVLYARK